MFSEKSIEEAAKYDTLGPAYFEARVIVEKQMATFEAEQFKPLLEKFTAAFREKLWEDVQDHLLGDTEMNLQGEMYRMVDACMYAILGGERWAIERYALHTYDARKAREAIAKHIPAELQDARIAELEAENKRLREDLDWYRRLD
jgi:hypothetical protein